MLKKKFENCSYKDDDVANCVNIFEKLCKNG